MKVRIYLHVSYFNNTHLVPSSVLAPPSVWPHSIFSTACVFTELQVGRQRMKSICFPFLMKSKTNAGPRWMQCPRWQHSQEPKGENNPGAHHLMRDKRNVVFPDSRTLLSHQKYSFWDPWWLSQLRIQFLISALVMISKS